MMRDLKDALVVVDFEGLVPSLAERSSPSCIISSFGAAAFIFSLIPHPFSLHSGRMEYWMEPSESSLITNHALAGDS